MASNNKLLSIWLQLFAATKASEEPMNEAILPPLDESGNHAAIASLAVILTIALVEIISLTCAVEPLTQVVWYTVAQASP